MLTREQVEHSIPRNGDFYDIIVAGGGPAGLSAAVAAAENGAKTLLLEARGFPGGVGSLALWMPTNRLFTEGRSRGGVHARFVQKIQSFGHDASTPGRICFTDGEGLDIHPEYLRLAAYELLEEVGCHYRMYSPVIGTIMEGGRVAGVVVSGKEGPEEFRAAVTVDATGDGDVAYYAGAEMMEGREEDGLHMPVALVFAVGNVETERFFPYIEQENHFQTLLQQAREEGYLTAAWYSFDRTTLQGVLSVNNGGVYEVGNIDGKNACELTIAERMGMQIAHDFIRLARDKRLPGMENCTLARVGSAVAVRDTRRIVGDYVLTVEDARTGPDFADMVARKYGAIDANQLFIGEMKSGYAYPYRCMLPKGIEGLLVAGRCGSATFLGHAAGKSMGNMMGLGQAAGVAAALCASQGIVPRALDAARIREKLREMDVILE